MKPRNSIVSHCREIEIREVTCELRVRLTELQDTPIKGTKADTRGAGGRVSALLLYCLLAYKKLASIYQSYHTCMVLHAFTSIKRNYTVMIIK